MPNGRKPDVCTARLSDLRKQNKQEDENTSQITKQLQE